MKTAARSSLKTVLTLVISLACAMSSLAVDVTIDSPSDQDIFCKDQTVQFKATVTGAVGTVSQFWTFTPPQGVQVTAPRSLTTNVMFTQQAEGKEIEAKITVVDILLPFICVVDTATIKVFIPKVEIEINKTSATNDDVVRLKSTVPNKRFKALCRARVQPALPQDFTVVLTNPDGKLGFPEAAHTTKMLVLPKDGLFVDFEISGQLASENKRDAVIQVHKDTAAGTKCGENTATVFSFDPADITVGSGGTYGIIKDPVDKDLRTYTVARKDKAAVNFSAAGVLKPIGLDCTIPQIVPLRIGISQNCLQVVNSVTYGKPKIKWKKGTPKGTVVKTPTTVAFHSTLDGPRYDFIKPKENNVPLYDRTSPNALKPPTGCPGGGSAFSNDMPSFTASSFIVLVARDANNNDVGDITYDQEKMEIDDSFRTWCVTLDIIAEAQEAVIPLRETTWLLKADSTQKDQKASPKGDSIAPTTNPVQAPDCVDSDAVQSRTRTGEVIFTR